MTSEPELICERRGAAGLMTLNRPKALNALTHGMVLAIADQLRAWARDSAVTRVVVRGAGERAFCAGGDLRFVVGLCRAGRQDEALHFWSDEYVMNTLIKRFPKPYVALIDGICMGGGVGVSVHGSHRVAGDRFLFAMPEVGIGFFPDVGGTWFLPRLPGEIGAFCAITGERLSAGDALASTIATHAVASERFGELTEELCGDAPVDAVLSRFARTVPVGPVMTRRSTIDRLFAGAEAEDILRALDAEAAGRGPDAEWARATAATIRSKSPTSVRVALAQVRRGTAWTFEECMQMEYRLATRLVREPDFLEGVRAVILDKDNAPRWRPPDLAGMSPAEVERFFAPLDTPEWRAP